MSENLIVVLSIIAIVAISLVAFVALVALAIYFTEKKVVAGWKVKAEKENIKTETDVKIEASEQQKN
jgi:hypothetical protein